MSDAARSGVLRRLRDHIARVENRPLLENGGGAALRARMGVVNRKTGDFRAWRDAPGGLVHEVWTTGVRDAGAGLGFGLGMARGLVSGSRPVILWLQPVHEAAETGLVYGAGLAHFGLEPDRIVIGRMKTTADLLWAAEEALGCTGVAAVIADVPGYPKGLDFTASRRLALRAAGSGASVMMLRYGTEKPASAAGMRWQVAPAPAGPLAFDSRASGAARFYVTLERAGAGLKGNWVLEWHDDGFGEIGEDAAATRNPGVSGPAASGGVVPVLGNGLSQTG